VAPWLNCPKAQCARTDGNGACTGDRGADLSSTAGLRARALPCHLTSATCIAAIASSLSTSTSASAPSASSPAAAPASLLRATASCSCAWAAPSGPAAPAAGPSSAQAPGGAGAAFEGAGVGQGGGGGREAAGVAESALPGGSVGERQGQRRRWVHGLGAGKERPAHLLWRLRKTRLERRAARGADLGPPAQLHQPPHIARHPEGRSARVQHFDRKC
jgi:hypothetical protein